MYPTFGSVVPSIVCIKADFQKIYTFKQFRSKMVVSLADSYVLQIEDLVPPPVGHMVVV